MSRKLDYANFDLQKVKVTPDGLSIHYFEKGTHHDKYIIECEGQPHPDFTTALEAFQIIMAKRLNLLKGWDLAREGLKKNSDLLKEAMQGHKAEIERCKVSGIVWVGNDQLSGIKITGSLKCDTASVGMATPNITFASEKLGYEEEAQKLAEDIRKETYLYHFKNKKAQQDLLSQVEEAEETDEADKVFELKGA